MGDPGRLPVHDAQLQPQTSCSRSNCLAGMWNAQVRPPEHVHHLEWTARLDRLGDGRESRHAEDGPHVWVHRNAIEALVEQEPENPERRPVLIVEAPTTAIRRVAASTRAIPASSSRGTGPRPSSRSR